ncbi:glycosyl transferase group 1 [Methylorubrum populi BJ001]|uniref:Glycosyl transferase group 1 n=1 Tax=Methylorubrum populi (strain ATCC BAA-705 / NCIMB 13946 / BJ001) TaxID=441620 RepID=B1ZCS7_METPB|nr:glycosyltransferase [Methylorubrum populi]ACB79439.1 glycosyl transferase group 1 [Methylorubrum populi BJ001]PZP69566.1 MAG: glycosyl transferase family 1 [Methylorubrum populi]
MPVRHPPAHILMTADALGGVWQYSLELATGLRQRGLTVTIALMGPAPSAAALAEAEAASGARILPTGLPLDWTAERPDAVLGAAAALARLARETGADLVHLHAPALALAAFDGPVVAVCHSCVATWWAAVGEGPLPDDLAWRARLAAEGCRAADRLLAPTRAFAEATQAAYGLSRAPEVVHNGRRSLETLPEAEPAAQPATQSATHAFTAGRLWDRAKNAAALDRLAARLDVPLLAAGPVEGPNGERFAGKHLRGLGRLDTARMERELGQRPVFVSLARYEPFGLAVLEAAGAGCALVLSDIPSFLELWEGAALFVAPDDDAAAAEAVRSLLADPDRRAFLAEAARARAARYGADAMADGVLAVFSHLLGETRSRTLAKPLSGAAA